MTADLKPCPFCGHKPYSDTDTAMIFGKRTGASFAIACSYCEAAAPGTPFFDGAVLEWNRRADLPALSAAAMKRAAHDLLDKHDSAPCKPPEAWADDVYGAYTDGQIDAARSWQGAILVLPDPSPADLLAEAARVLLAKWDADTASGLVYGPNEFAALLRAIAGGEA